MTDYEYIIKHYDSFVDNVLSNQSPEFWADTLSDPEDGPGYLFDGLSGAVKEWRERLEAAEPNGCIRCGAPGHDQPGCQWTETIYVDEIIGTNCYINGQLQPKREGTRYVVGAPDPHHTEEWYAAIDRDIEYQNEFRGED